MQKHRFLAISTPNRCPLFIKIAIFNNKTDPAHAFIYIRSTLKTCGTMAGMDLSVLLDETRRAPLVSDLSALIDRTISEQSGITGMAIKGAAATAKKLQADIVPVGVNRLLPNLLGSLQPHADEAAAADAEFGAYLADNVEAVTGDLLKVGDDAIANSDNAAVHRIYKTVRGKASSLIEPVLPELGALIERHYAAK
ncbi:Uncharacterised protein [Corynebacterium renale]|nr:Uncharacterised protein [Corynebacterium renale]